MDPQTNNLITLMVNMPEEKNNPYGKDLVQSPNSMVRALGPQEPDLISNRFFDSCCFPMKMCTHSSETRTPSRKP